MKLFFFIKRIKSVISIGACLPVALSAFVFDLDEIKKHIETKFSEVNVELEPFPHFIISEILPKDLYDYLLEQWPDEAAFDHNSSVRQRLPVTGGAIDQRPVSFEQKNAWKIFAEIIVNQYIKEKTKEILIHFIGNKLALLESDVSEMARNNIEFMNYRSDGLNQDKYPYSIGPHVDQAYIFSAILLYFPKDCSHSKYGTTFYKSSINRTSIDTVFPDLSEFEKVKTIPFLPNTLAVFLQNPNSWHGVERIDEPGYVRRAYHATLNFKPEFAEKIYGSDMYRASDLYIADEQYLNPENFHNY